MSDIYVKITDLPGEATETDYLNQIKCVSIRHAIGHQIASGGSRTVGNSRHGGVELTHGIDKATPKLHAASAAGTNLGTVTITRVSSTRIAEVITLLNAYVVRVDIDTPVDADTLLPDDKEPVETFALSYSRIDWDVNWWNANNVKATVNCAYDKSTGVVS